MHFLHFFWGHSFSQLVVVVVVVRVVVVAGVVVVVGVVVTEKVHVSFLSDDFKNLIFKFNGFFEN